MRLFGATFAFISLLCMFGCSSSNSTSTSNSAPTVSSINVTPGTPSIQIGSTQQFKAVANYSDGTSKDVTASATWTSSNAAAASVQSSGQTTPGLATGMAAGTANISASFGGSSGTATLTVTGITPAITSIVLGPPSSSIHISNTVQFSATATYSDGSTRIVTNSATWQSSNSGIAAIQSTGQTSPGLATGVAAGSTTITATFGGVSGATSLTVRSGSAVVTSVSISPTSVSISVGGTQQFGATAGYSDGSSLDVTTLATWSSSNTSVATVQSVGQTSPGLADGVTAGNVNISASFSAVVGVTILNVTSTSGNLTAFSLSQINPYLAPGATQQEFGFADYSNGSSQWVTSTTHWTSSNPSVATVGDQGQASPGLVTAVATGTATITGSFGGLQQTTTVTVANNAVPIDIMDMTASNNYLSFQGGLYENFSLTPPTDHDAAGKAAAAAIQPLSQSGSPSSTGAVVFLGIGMSNATEEFSAFAATANASSSVNHATLAIEDGALAGVTACYWTVAQGQTGTACPRASGVLLENQYDRVRDTVLATAVSAPSAPAGCGGPPNPTPCLTEAQVQALWIKNANPGPGVSGERTLCDETVSGCVNDLDTEAILYESQLGQTIRAARSRYPNLKQIFLSTRIYAGYAADGLNPEPYAYQYGYSAKWLIEAQVLQIRNGTVDPIAGDVSYTDGSAAWTAWGTYLWADGSIARSDGLVWLPADFGADGTHPSSSGITKVVNLLMGFYLASPYSPWFRP